MCKVLFSIDISCGISLSTFQWPNDEGSIFDDVVIAAAAVVRLDSRVQMDPIRSDSDQNCIRIRFNFSNMNMNTDSFGYEYGSDIKRIRIRIG
jgi:hypothetical protein